MRQSTLLRFVLLGAASFGAGLALGPILLGLSSFFAAGVLGGVALGAAWRDMRTAAALGVASAVGFGVGSFTSLFIMFSSQTMEGLVSRWVFLGVVAGVLGGAAMGLALWSLALLDWKVIVTLALVGALGFGIGGGVQDILRTRLVELRPGVSVLWPTLYFGIQGAIGGAALGAALGILKRRQNLEDLY